MGTKMAPSYANTVMGSLEDSFLQFLASDEKPLIWIRYIDDIFSNLDTWGS